MTLTREQLYELPKAHLHLHLVGAMRPATLAELADRYGETVPPIGGRFGSFADFADLYMAASGLLRALEDLARLVDEIVADAVADGVVWVEVAAHPPDHADLGPPEAVLEALLDAGAAASNAHGVGVGWLLTADRTREPSLAMAMAELGARYAERGVVSFGLANDEVAGPAAPFAPAFALARSSGLLSAPHAGEHGGPSSVVAALDALGADRIQHGVQAVDAPAVVERLVEGQTCLDVCPTSNVLLSVVPDLAHHPLPDLLAAGVPCSINADDPLLFDIGVLDEYVICHEELGLGADELAACARASVGHSGAPGELKARATARVDDWLSRYGEDPS
ncbi:MAG TPA: adenosine deaminase [Acidimicrobiales bacterium]|nr:adenosine deaminase [Acidimicrobiales bacterium]